MLFELAEGALRFLVPINLHGHGLGPSQIGLVLFAFSLASLLSRGIAGGLFRPDRARALVVVAGLASTLAYLPVPWVEDAAIFTLLMGIDGFGWGIATTALLALVMLRTPPGVSPAVAMGWYIGFQGLAMALATTVGGVLAQTIGVTGAMLGLAVVPVLAAALIAIRLPSVDPAAGADPAAEAETAAMAVDEDGGGIRPEVLRRLGTVPWAVWVAAIVAVYLNVMNGLLQAFFPLLGLAIGLSVAEIGTLSSVRSGVSAVSRFGSGWLTARVGAGRLHVPLLVLSAGTLALLPSGGGYLALLPLLALNGVSRGLLRVTTSATAMVATPPRQAGVAAALMTGGLDVGKMIGPLVGGLTASAVGLDAMFRIVPLAFLSLYLVLSMLARRVVRAVAGTHRTDGGAVQEA
jgi:predicted MFS family arabinose efflux permease